MTAPKRLRSGKTLLIVSAALLVGIGAAAMIRAYYSGWTLTVQEHTTTGEYAPGPHAPATQDGSLARRPVVAHGRLEPEGGVINVGVPVGDRLERVLAEEGAQVKSGQELARLESYPDRLADRNLAASQLQEAQNRLTAVTAAGKASIREAEIRIQQIQKLDPLDVRAQEAKVRLLEEQLASVQGDLKRLQALKENTVSKQQLEAQMLAVRKGEEELAAAQAGLEKLKSGHAINLDAAQAQLEAAKANLTRFQAEIPVESLKRTLDLAESRLKHAVIRAPSDGKILKIIARPGETLGTRPILQMADTSRMLAIAEVYETEVKRIRKDAKATVTSPALPAPLSGTVMHVGSMVAKNRLLDLDPTAAADYRVVEVKVRLDDSSTAADFIQLQVKVAIAAEDPSNK